MYSPDSSFISPKAPDKPKIKRWHQKWWGRLIIVFLFIFLALLIAVIIYVGKVVLLLRSGEVSPSQLLGDDYISQRQELLKILVTKDDPSFGNPKAKVVIVEFSDFDCPASQQASGVVEQIRNDYSDKVFFVFRDFPVTGDPTKSLIASLAASCANEQGKFWEMHDRIFADQASISELTLKTYAVQIGINAIQFGDCLNSKKYLEEMQKDFEDGVNLGVKATPTFFINGIPVAGAIRFADFEKIITLEASK